MAIAWGTREQIRGTATLLRWYRAFIRSDAERANIPGEWGRTMTKAQAQRRLSAMIDTAINHKGTLDKPRGRKDGCDYQMRLWRDKQRLISAANRIRIYQFETQEAQERFSHLLSRYDD